MLYMKLQNMLNSNWEYVFYCRCRFVKPKQRKRFERVVDVCNTK